MKKWIMLIGTLLISSVFLYIVFQESQPKKHIYSFYSEEDEYYFRRIIGKLEGNIYEEDAIYYMDIMRAGYRSLYREKASVYSDDHKLVIERYGYTDQENIDDIIKQSKFSLFAYNYKRNGEKLDVYLVETILNSNDALEKRTDMEKFGKRYDESTIFYMKYRVSMAFMKMQRDGQWLQYVQYEDILDLNPEDWDTLYTYWEENMKK